MSDEEEDHEARKGPSKCFGGGLRRGSFFRVGLPCKVPATSRPTAISQCMEHYTRDGICRAGPPEPPQNPRDERGYDNFPPQGGTLSKTCGVKALFTGEIVIKKDIPPRPPTCIGESLCQLNFPEFGPVPAFEEPNPDPLHCPKQIRHHLAPKCQVPLFPKQPEISESCRRVLRSRGPDSSRNHPECPCVCPTEDDDDEVPCMPAYYQPCPCETYDDTSHEAQSYVDMRWHPWLNPVAWGHPAEYHPPDVGHIYEFQEFNPRCPGAWEGPPPRDDILTNLTWAQQLQAMTEPTRCRPPCNPPAFNPQTEDQTLNTPHFDYYASPSCI